MSSFPPPLMEQYPHPVIGTPSSSSYRGSFGPVFIVLAVIAVLAAFACFVGRLCARRHWESKAGSGRTHVGGDVEDGLDVGAPKPAACKLGAAKIGEAKPDMYYTGFKVDPATRQAGTRPEQAAHNPRMNYGSKSKFVTMDFK